MAQSITAQKTAFTTDMIAFAQQLETLLESNDEFIAYYNNEFTGGNVFVDADFATQFPWITAALMTSMITTLTALQTAMTPTNRNNLRAIKAGP